MSIKSDFDWLNLNMIIINDNDFINKLNIAYKRMIFFTHPDRGNINNYNKTIESYNNILYFINKRKNAYKKIKKGEKKDIFCRCGSIYLIIKDEIFIDCLYCSCFIEIID